MGNNTYDFCPKCGALVRNGVCTSCGADYNPPKEPEWVSGNNEMTEGLDGAEAVEAAEVKEGQSQEWVEKPVVVSTEQPQAETVVSENIGTQWQKTEAVDPTVVSTEQPEDMPVDNTVVSIEQPETENTQTGSPSVQSFNQMQAAGQFQGGNSYQNGNFQNNNYQSGAYQNGNNPNGQQYNYYGGQMPAGYVPTEKKKSNKVLIGVIVAVCLLVIVLLVYIGNQLAALSKQAILDKKSQDSQVEKSEDPFSFGDYSFPDFQDDDSEKKEADESQMDQEADEDYWDEYADEHAFEFNEKFKEDRENYDASQITGPYYEGFVNCIDENVSYKVNREFYEELDKENGASMQVSYIQLEGDIPNLDTINERIKELSMAYTEAFLEDKESFKANYEQYGAVFNLNVESYVTYNDEDIISIVLDSNYSYYFTGGLNVYAININLKTGTILDNTEILNIDEAFVEEFCERSNAQNGEDSIGVKYISNSEKLTLLNNDTYLIIFYTPIGLEVGYNYSNVEGYSGWVTISLEEYEQYLKGL